MNELSVVECIGYKTMKVQVHNAASPQRMTENKTGRQGLKQLIFQLKTQNNIH